MKTQLRHSVQEDLSPPCCGRGVSISPATQAQTPRDVPGSFSSQPALPPIHQQVMLSFPWRPPPPRSSAVSHTGGLPSWSLLARSPRSPSELFEAWVRECPAAAKALVASPGRPEEQGAPARLTSWAPPPDSALRPPRPPSACCRAFAHALLPASVSPQISVVLAHPSGLRFCVTFLGEIFSH